MRFGTVGGGAVTAEPDLLGRERELVELEAGLEQAAGGRSRVFLLTGDPGIGKSRLAEVFAHRAEARGFLVAWGRCWAAEGAPAFWPWVQVIRSVIEDLGDAVVSSCLSGGAEPLVHFLPELRERVPGLLVPDLPAEPEQARFLLFDAVTTFVRRAVSSRPIALFLEDLHWADPPSARLLQYLAGNLGRSRLLAVGIYRDVEMKRSERLARALGALAPHASEIPLRGLPESETRALAECSGWTSPTPRFVEILHRATAGNPLYVSQVVRLLLAEGVRDARGDLSGGRIVIPGGVREALRSRVALASSECRELLAAASIFGNGVSVPFLSRLRRVPADAVVSLVDEADALGILAPRPTPIHPLRFAHDLFRETVYEDLAPAVRLELHRAAAEMLERLYRDDLEAHAGEIAHHLLRARPVADPGKATFFAAAAGDRAMRHFAWEEAIDDYGGAIESLDLRDEGDERLRCELLLKLGEALWSAGEFERSRDVSLAAAGIAERLGLREELARAALGAGGQFPNFGMANADVVLFELIGRAARNLEPDDPLRALLVARAAGALALTVAWEQAAWLGESALEMARRCREPRTLAYVLAATLNATWNPDNLETRLHRAGELIGLASRLRENRLATDGHTFRLSYLLELGDAEAVAQELREIERLLEALPQPYVRWVVTTCRAMRALYEGRLAEAESLVQEALEVGQEGENTNAALTFAGQFFYLRWKQGRLAEMLPPIEGMLAQYPAMPVWRAALAWVYADLGRNDEAAAEIERIAQGGFAAVPRDMTWLFTMSTIAEVVAMVGDEPRARALYEILRPYETRCPVASFTIYAGSLARWLGLLATTSRDLTRAADHFERALGTNRRMRARAWIALTERDYARMLLRRGGPGDAARAAGLLRSAAVAAREMGMEALARRAADDLASVDADGTRVKPTVPSSAPTLEGAFRREGDYWEIAFGPRSFRLHDAKGFGYLATLLKNPAHEIPALELATSAASAPAPRGLGGDGLRVRAGSGAMPVLDAQAKSEYRRRLDELRSELEEAQSFHDVGRTQRLVEEIEAISAELGRAVGFHGRDRRVGDDAERARQAVTQAVRRVFDRIARESPDLGEHLRCSVRIGIFCCYRPDPTSTVRWRL